MQLDFTLCVRTLSINLSFLYLKALPYRYHYQLEDKKSNQDVLEEPGVKLKELLSYK